MRPLFFIILGSCTTALLFTGCNYAEDPEPNLPETVVPAAPRPNIPAATSKERSFDELGRLREAADRVYHYQIPIGLWLRRASAGLREFELVTSEAPLLEFYTHRRYHIVRKGAGYKILHTSETRENLDINKEDISRASLHITRISRRGFKLRFLHSRARNYVPAINREFLEERDDLESGEKVQLKSRIEVEQGKAEGNLPRIRGSYQRPPSRPFNPSIPRNTGNRVTRPKVKEWLQNHPGAVFYD